MLLPIEICNSLNFNFNYPYIEIKPWDDVVEKNISEFCKLISYYTHPEWWSDQISAFEEKIRVQKTPHKVVNLSEIDMDGLYPLLDGMRSNYGSPSGKLEYQRNYDGKFYFDRAEKIINEIVSEIKNIPLNDGNDPEKTPLTPVVTPHQNLDIEVDFKELDEEKVEFLLALMEGYAREQYIDFVAQSNGITAELAEAKKRFEAMKTEEKKKPQEQKPIKFSEVKQTTFNKHITHNEVKDNASKNDNYNYICRIV